MPNELGCIAVVDDDPIMGESLQRALELEGWRVCGGKRQAGRERDGRDLSGSGAVRHSLPDMSGEEVFPAANVALAGGAVHIHDSVRPNRPGGRAGARRATTI